MNAWIRSARPTAIAIVTASSISDFIADFFFCLDTPIELQEAEPVGRPVREERLADDPRLGDGAPEAAVVRCAPVVAHHVVVALRDGDRAREGTRASGAARIGVAVLLAHPIADH